MPDFRPPLAVGIDLGTTYTCISYIDEFGQAVILKNFENDALTPSVVYIPEVGSEAVVGKEAKKQKSIEPERVVEFVKRSIGRPNSQRNIGGNDYRPEEISAYILKKVLQDAEQKLNREIGHAVITCPAYFGMNEREATAQAGYIAGMTGFGISADRPEIIPEPIAAAFYYGLQNSGKKETVLVFDLGGGTLDVTVLAIDNGSIDTLSICGEHELGGKDWDDALANFCIEEARECGANAEDIYNDPIALADLGTAVEEAKRSLSVKEKTVFALSLGTTRLKLEITRPMFEALTENLLERCMICVYDALDAAAKKGAGPVERVLLVGGSTRMPQIRNRLKQEFENIEVEYNDPDEAVAKGAAFYAQKLLVDRMLHEEFGQNATAGAESFEAMAFNQSHPQAMAEATERVAATIGLPSARIDYINHARISNITSKSFGVVIVDKRSLSGTKISNLILKNSSLPARVARPFSTSVPNQNAAEIRIMENLSNENIVEVHTGIEIGRAVLPLVPGLEEGSPLEITFDLGDTGMLKFSGKDLRGDNLIDGEVQTAALMSQDELDVAVRRSRAICIS